MTKVKKTREERTKIGKVLYDIGQFFARLSDKVKPLIPVAIKIVEGIKRANTDPGVDALAEILKYVIKGEKDDRIIDKAREAVEKFTTPILLELFATQEILNVEDKNEQLRLILVKLQSMTKDARKMVWTSTAQLLVEYMADGELTWAEAAEVAKHIRQKLIEAGELE